MCPVINLNNEAQFRKRLNSGTWEPLARTKERYKYDQAYKTAIAVGPDGIVHVLYQTFKDLWYQEVFPDGNMTTQTTIYSSAAPQMVVDSQNRLHILLLPGYDGHGYPVYLQRDAEGAWLDPKTLAHSRTVDANMVVDEQDRVHIVASLSGDNQIHYYYLDTKFGSFEHYTIPATYANATNVAIALDPASTISIIWSDSDSLIYRTTAHATNEEEGFISQEISVPPNLNHPTLDLMYNLDAPADWNQSAFEVTVTDDLTITSLLSTTKGTGWSHFWADLLPWAGQTISVTFGLHQAAGDPFVQLSLDNISAGAWLTPVPQAVSPKQIGDISGSPVITITGDNFINPVEVRLNHITMTDVVWVDEHTLQVTLPASLPSGVYHLWVTNPGGQAGAIPQGFQAGQFIYLPLILR